MVFQDSGKVTRLQDTLPPPKTGKDTFAHPSDTSSLNDLERLFLQSERRLKADSAKKARKSKIVPLRERNITEEKKGQDPYDSLVFHALTSRQPLNTPPMVLERTFSLNKRWQDDSSRTVRPPEKRKIQSVIVQPVPGVAMERQTPYLREDWMLGILIFAFLLFIWAKIRFGKIVNQTLTALWNPKNSHSLYRNRSSVYQWAGFLLLFCSFLILPLFFYLYLKGVCPEQVETGRSFVLYLKILTGVAGAYLYFQIMLRIVGFISLAEEELNEFRHFTRLFFLVAGLWLFPLTVLVPYVYIGVAQSLLRAGAAMLILFYLFRIVKLISIFLRERFSFFFMILYLCGLEFLPVALLWKYLFR